MVEAAHIKRIVGTVGIGADDAVRLDFTENNGHQRRCPGVVNDGGVDLALAFEDAKNSDLACS